MTFHTHCPFPILFLKEAVAVCVLVVYTIPNSFSCVSLEDLVLLILVNGYLTCTSQSF